MPVPISWQGNPSRAQPSGRALFFTHQANSAICTFNPEPGGARIKSRAWVGLPESMHWMARRSMKPSLTWQSASTMIKTSGASLAR
ncbi:hypothetical protein D3C73_1400990 [compost metagenome]